MQIVYKHSKSLQDHAEKQFRIRGNWDDWLKANYGKLISALNNEEVDNLKKIFSNIFREPLTIGTLSGFDGYLRHKSFFGKLYTQTIWNKYYNLLKDINFDFKKLDFPAVGNQSGVKINNKVITYETLRHAYHATELNTLIKNIEKPVIVEIGGGLGGMAYQTFKLSNKKEQKYYIFDIPEVLTLCAFFLIAALPEKKICLFGEKVNNDTDYDIILMPYFLIHNIENLKIDCFYNSCSLSEIDSECSKEYLKVINKSCEGYFLTDNHETRLIFKYPDGTVSRNLKGSEFVPDSNKFRTVYKKRRKHGLPEDIFFNYYSYLYEKIKK